MQNSLKLEKIQKNSQILRVPSDLLYCLVINDGENYEHVYTCVHKLFAM